MVQGIGINCLDFSLLVPVLLSLSEVSKRPLRDYPDDASK